MFENTHQFIDDGKGNCEYIVKDHGPCGCSEKNEVHINNLTTDNEK